MAKNENINLICIIYLLVITLLAFIILKIYFGEHFFLNNKISCLFIIFIIKIANAIAGVLKCNGTFQFVHWIFNTKRNFKYPFN